MKKFMWLGTILNASKSESIVKSSTKDLSLAIFEIVIQSYDLGPKPIVIRFRSRKVNIDDFQHGF